MYNPVANGHFYTTNAEECDTAVNTYGYKFERIEGYVYTTQVKDTVPFYRGVYELNGVGLHFYTTFKAEMPRAVAQYDYKYGRVAAYVFPQPQASN